MNTNLVSPPFSATRIEILQLCLRKYYYEYIKPLKEYEVIDRDLTLGLYFHKMAELLWTGEPGNLRHKYKSKDSFLGAATGYFKRYVAKTDSYQGRKIEWSAPNQKWILLNSVIPEVLSNYYDLTKKEDPPLGVEVQFKIMVDSEFYVGRIDEIRKNGSNGLIIRDHKYYPHKIPKEMEKQFNPQFTVYALTLTADLREYGEISKTLKLSRERANEIAGNEVISENIQLEYHLFKQNMIIPATRRLEHFLDLKDTVTGLNEKRNYAFETGNFYAERGRHCDYCLHKKRCLEDTLRTGDNTNIPVQIRLFEIDRRFLRKKGSKKDQVRINFPRQKIKSVGKL